MPGLTNAWTMPIRTRLDMLTTGIKTPVGIKIAGPDLEVLEHLGTEIERVMRGIPGTLSAFSERVMGGNYLDITIDRETIARHGLVVDEVQEAIRTALGGVQVGTTVEGLQRFSGQPQVQQEPAGGHACTAGCPGDYADGPTTFRSRSWRISSTRPDPPRSRARTPGRMHGSTLMSPRR